MLNKLTRKLIIFSSGLFLITGFADCGQLYGRFKYKIKDCNVSQGIQLPLDEIKTDDFVIYQKTEYPVCPGVQNFNIHFNRGQGIRKERLIPIYAGVSKKNVCELHVVVAFGNTGMKKKREGIIENGRQYADDFAKLIFSKTEYKSVLPAIETDTAITDSELKKWCDDIQSKDN